jgi:type IV secretory pathway VirD2 relaxase
MSKNTEKDSISATPTGRRDSPAETLMDNPVFRVRIGMAHPGRPPKIKGFVGRIKAMLREHGGATQGRHRSTAGVGGSAAARLTVRSSPQRVIIKARVVKHAKYAARAGGALGMLAKHMDYLGRGSAAEDRTRGVLFNAEKDLDAGDLRALRSRIADDRHHFRFIVSPEAGKRLNLKDFARELVREMQTDLGTTLTWIGAAHYDTDEPHVHLFVRGKDARGNDLVINRNYIAHGMRLQAMEVATRHLGPRLPEEIERAMKRDLKAERVTGIDLGLAEQAAGHPEGWVSALRRPDGSLAFEQQRLNTLARLQYLESLGLAREIRPGIWRPDRDLVPRLRALGMRGDIIKLMHQRLQGINPGAVPVTTDRAPETPVIGRVAARGTADELTEDEYLVVEARDGQAYYVPVGEFSKSREADLPVGAIVRLKSPAPAGDPADARIAAIAAADGGVYDAHTHAAAGSPEAPSREILGADPSPESTLQRARALSRRGLLEDLGGDRFRVPADLAARVAATLNRRRPGIEIERLSGADLKTQTTQNGVTWLDREIANGAIIGAPIPVGATRFERELASAFEARAKHLESLGLGEINKSSFRARGALLDDLYERELHDADARLSVRFGERVPLPDRGTLKGHLAAIEELPSGPHAVFELADGYALVPAGPALARQVGKDLKLSLGRGRGSPALGEEAPKIAIRFSSLELNRTRRRGR